MPHNRNIRKKYFRSISAELVSSLQLDHEAKYSVTESSLAKLQALIIADCVKSAGYVPAETIITDGTASIGGNVFEFVKIFMGVHAVEISRSRSLMLAHNVKLLNIHTQVAVWCGDIAHVDIASRKLKHDVLFLDPPWTGNNYKKIPKLMLFLTNRSLMRVCNDWAEKTRLIALKLPVNFDFDSFFDITQPRRYQEVERIVLGYHNKMFGNVVCAPYVMKNDKLVTRMRYPKMILLVIRTTLAYV